MAEGGGSHAPARLAPIGRGYYNKKARKVTDTGDASDLLLLSWRLPTAAEPLEGLNRSSADDEVAADDDAAAAAASSTSASSTSQRPELSSADVLWGQWTSNLQFFDRRLRAGQMVNSLMGLEHDTLGTPVRARRRARSCAAAPPRAMLSRCTR